MSGQMRAPDGTAATQGTVALMMTPANLVTATIDRDGRFRVVPDAPGWQRLFIAVPGYAPHRVHVTVPPSRRIALPPRRGRCSSLPMLKASPAPPFTFARNRGRASRSR